MPLMPAPEERPLPLARAQARLAYDALLHSRQVALLDAGARDDERLVEALARSFADAVDRGNDGRQYLRQAPIDYVDAVVLSGSSGELLVDGVEYDEAPTYWQARAGEVDAVIRGRDLDGYLRTGDARYREPLGLPA